MAHSSLADRGNPSNITGHGGCANNFTAGTPQTTQVRYTDGLNTREFPITGFDVEAIHGGSRSAWNTAIGQYAVTRSGCVVAAPLASQGNVWVSGIRFTDILGYHDVARQGGLSNGGVSGYGGCSNALRGNQGVANTTITTRITYSDGHNTRYFFNDFSMPRIADGSASTSSVTTRHACIHGATGGQTNTWVSRLQINRNHGGDAVGWDFGRGTTSIYRCNNYFRHAQRHYGFSRVTDGVNHRDFGTHAQMGTVSTPAQPAAGSCTPSCPGHAGFGGGTRTCDWYVPANSNTDGFNTVWGESNSGTSSRSCPAIPHPAGSACTPSSDVSNGAQFGNVPAQPAGATTSSTLGSCSSTTNGTGQCCMSCNFTWGGPGNTTLSASNSVCGGGTMPGGGAGGGPVGGGAV